MNQNERGELLKHITALSVYYQRALPDIVLKMYADDLNDLPFNDVIKAYDGYRLDPKNRTMPLPAQIRAIIQPSADPDSLARETVSRILEAQDRFGYTYPADAKQFIGEIGWSVIRAYGGWENFCSGLGIHFSIDSFNAQARELLKGRIIYGDKIGEMASQIPYERKSIGLEKCNYEIITHQKFDVY